MRYKFNTEKITKAISKANENCESSFLIISEDLDEFAKYTKMCKEHFAETGEVA